MVDEVGKPCAKISFDGGDNCDGIITRQFIRVLHRVVECVK